MRTITKTLYLFNELSEESKQYAINHFRFTNTDTHWANETYNSLKALLASLPLKIDRLDLSSDYARLSITLDDDISELSGSRAIGWLENNLLTKLRVTRSAYLQRRKDYANWKGYKIGMIKPCTFTGYCHDDELLDDLVSSIKSGLNLHDSIVALADCTRKALERDEEYQNSDEYIAEHIIANEYEFDENGTYYS